MSSSANSYASRVSQLDAAILDHELYNFVKNQLIKIFDKLQLSKWLQYYEPEFEFILGSALWKITVGYQQCTIGQKLLGLKYPDVKSSQRLYYIFSTLVPYLHNRVGQYLLKRNAVTASQLRRVASTWKICQILNFCLFLMQNKYTTLSHRFAKFQMISAIPKQPYPPGDSYQIRELLWHQFSDFLMIIVPLIKLHIVKRYWASVTNYWSPKKTGAITGNSGSERQDVVAKCCFCNQDAVIPQFVNKCAFCYYCLRANQLADAQFVCTNCSHTR